MNLVSRWDCQQKNNCMLDFVKMQQDIEREERLVAHEERIAEHDKLEMECEAGGAER